MIEPATCRVRAYAPTTEPRGCCADSFAWRVQGKGLELLGSDHLISHSYTLRTALPGRRGRSHLEPGLGGCEPGAGLGLTPPWKSDHRVQDGS